MWVKDPEGGLARAHRLGGRQAGHARLGTGPVFDFARKRSFWTAPVMSPGVRTCKKTAV
jgi:hypothetical protein